jgi:hypothetical protein
MEAQTADRRWGQYARELLEVVLLSLSFCLSTSILCLSSVSIMHASVSIE